MSKIEEIGNKYRIVYYYKTSTSTVDGDYEDFEKAMEEYAEYYAKIAIRNTRYKAIEIVQSNLERPDIIEKEIQNIQNQDVLPPHD